PRSEDRNWASLLSILRSDGWTDAALRDLDESSTKVVAHLPSPHSREDYQCRGLVLGYVQSGKTTNFTAVIAKAADAGYRLFIVLSGIHKGLRRQTNARLKKELVGYAAPRGDSVPLPPLGLQWHEFTREEFDGDFRPGLANHAALQ